MVKAIVTFLTYDEQDGATPSLPSAAHPFGPCGYKFCDWPDGELRCNEPRSASPLPSADDHAPALCPCCDAMPQTLEDYKCFDGGALPGWQIRCDNCGLQTCWWHSLEEAITKWNTRAATSFAAPEGEQNRIDPRYGVRCPLCGRRPASDFDPDVGIWYECTHCDYRWQPSNATTQSSSDQVARAAAEEIADRFGLREREGWKTVGRIKIDRESETETFERATSNDPTKAEEIAAIISRHLELLQKYQSRRTTQSPEVATQIAKEISSTFGLKMQEASLGQVAAIISRHLRNAAVPEPDLLQKIREAVELERVHRKDADWNRGYNEAIEDALNAIDRTISAWKPVAPAVTESAAQAFVRSAFLYLNTISGSDICDDRGCIRCRIADAAFEVERSYAATSDKGEG